MAAPLPSSDPLRVANDLYAEVTQDPFDSVDRERLRVISTLSQLSMANDVRRLADQGDKNKP